MAGPMTFCAGRGADPPRGSADTAEDGSLPAQ